MININNYAQLWGILSQASSLDRPEGYRKS
jgi:hypothetical protein